MSPCVPGPKDLERLTSKQEPNFLIIHIHHEGLAEGGTVKWFLLAQ